MNIQMSFKEKTDQRALSPWKTIKTKKLIEDKWLTLRADTCETERGIIVDPFYVVECSDWVEIVAFNDNEEILLIQQYRHGAGKISTEIPSGIMESEDASPIEAAKRELLEETGCSAERFEHVGWLHPNPARQNNKNHCILAMGTRVIQEPQPDLTEDIRFEFVPLKKLIELIEKGTFFQALHISSLFLALKHRGLIAFKFD